MALPACLCWWWRARQVEEERRRGTYDGPGQDLTTPQVQSGGPARRHRLQSHRDSRAEKTVRGHQDLSESKTRHISDSSDILGPSLYSNNILNTAEVSQQLPSAQVIPGEVL